MDWATHHIEKLKAGLTVEFRPRGNSMSPRIKSGALVTVRPRRPDEFPDLGAAVLCKVGAKSYLHLVKAVDQTRMRCQIGNNKGFINGWTPLEKVFGIVTAVGQ